MAAVTCKEIWENILNRISIFNIYEWIREGETYPNQQMENPCIPVYGILKNDQIFVHFKFWFLLLRKKELKKKELKKDETAPVLSTILTNELNYYAERDFTLGLFSSVVVLCWISIFVWCLPHFALLLLLCDINKPLFVFTPFTLCAPICYSYAALKESGTCLVMHALTCGNPRMCHFLLVLREIGTHNHPTHIYIICSSMFFSKHSYSKYRVRQIKVPQTLKMYFKIKHCQIVIFSFVSLSKINLRSCGTFFLLTLC